MAGKGDTPRPLTVSVEEFERRFEKAFPGGGGNGRATATSTAGREVGKSADGAKATEGPAGK